jgi:hypothetical protein
MHVASCARAFTQCALLLPIAVVAACSDAPTTITPTVSAAPRDLLAPPVVTVTNTDDAGAGSLRQAVIDAPADAVIRFDAAIAGRTVVLTTGEISMSRNVTIEGPVSAGMTISGNLASRVFRVEGTANVVLRNLSIVNGRTPANGGGVLNDGTVTIDHALVANNVADEGGGLFLSSVSKQSTILNSTISGNVAGFVAGGVRSAETSVIIRNSTIAENASVDGGGLVAVRGFLIVHNSIVANNVDSDPLTNGVRTNCVINNDVTAVFSGTNLVNDDSCGTGSAFVIASPLLAPLASNGGPTKTYALRFGSPAIDAGTACSEDTDARYVTRPQGTSCDIGAFELDKFATATLALAPNVSVTKAGVATVAGTVSCSAPGVVAIDVTLSQTQKTTGKFTTIVQAAGSTSVSCAGTTSWTVVLTPTTGKFDNGAMTGSANTLGAHGFLPSTATSTLKAFTVK